MTLRIDLSTDLAERLQQRADAAGVAPETYATQTLARELGNGKPSRMLELLAEWEREDAAATPEEVAQAERDWETFKKAIDEDRLSYRKLYP